MRPTVWVSMRASMRALLAGAALAMLSTSLSGCGLLVRSLGDAVDEVAQSPVFVQGRRGALDEREKAWAQIAWLYVQNNSSDGNGLVAGVDKGGSASVWDMGDTLAALLAAEALGLIDASQYDQRTSQLLHFLNRMPLVYGQLPNLRYATRDGAMLLREDRPGEAGWSAQDLGHLLLWLRIVADRKPYLASYIDRIIQRWNFCEALGGGNGRLRSARIVGGRLEFIESERLGWEQYATAGFRAWGLMPGSPAADAPFETVYVNGIAIDHDSRDPRVTGERDSVSAGPYLLSGLAYNWDRIEARDNLETTHSDGVLAARAQALYAAHEARYAQDHVLSARMRHRSARTAGLIDDSVYALGFPWNTLTESGQFAPDYALLATGAAFGTWALWRSDYSDALLDNVRYLQDRKRGWYEGRIEQTGGYDPLISLATNAMVLTALLYKQGGPIWPATTTAPLPVQRDPVLGRQGCLPMKPAACAVEGRCP